MNEQYFKFYIKFFFIKKLKKLTCTHDKPYTHLHKSDPWWSEFPGRAEKKPRKSRSRPRSKGTCAGTSSRRLRISPARQIVTTRVVLVICGSYWIAYVIKSFFIFQNLLENRFLWNEMRRFRFSEKVWLCSFCSRFQITMKPR